MLPLYLFPQFTGVNYRWLGIIFAGLLRFQWLWNITMPDVFNLKKINYWQAFRLLLIAALLFGCVRLG